MVTYHWGDGHTICLHQSNVVWSGARVNRSSVYQSVRRSFILCPGRLREPPQEALRILSSLHSSAGLMAMPDRSCIAQAGSQQPAERQPLSPADLGGHTL